MSEIEGGSDVDLEGDRKTLVAPFAERAVKRGRRVVDQDGDGADPSNGLLDQLGPLLAAGHVGGDANRASAGQSDPSRSLFEAAGQMGPRRVEGARGKHDYRPLRRETLGDSGPDPSACPGDEGDLALELTHVAKARSSASSTEVARDFLGGYQTLAGGPNQGLGSVRFRQVEAVGLGHRSIAVFRLVEEQ